MRHMHGWDTALDAQTSLLASFHTTAGREYLSWFVESLVRAGTIDLRTGQETPDDEDARRDVAEGLVAMVTASLQNCEPMYVNSDIAELIDFAAETFTPEPIIETDLLIPYGFAWFDKPLYVYDSRGLKMPFRAFQWCRDDDGVFIALYWDGRDPDPDAGRDHKVGGSDLTLEYATAMRFGQDSEVFDTDRSIRDMLAHVKVFFRLCQQTIAVPHRERVARPVWKRAAHWKQIKEVIVFTLRRAKPPKYEGEEREVQWTHRWWVSGHWRNQPYKENGNVVHRQIWIAPFIKGPDGKPIVYKRRAFELVR